MTYYDTMVEGFEHMRCADPNFAMLQFGLGECPMSFRSAALGTGQTLINGPGRKG